MDKQAWQKQGVLMVCLWYNGTQYIRAYKSLFNMVLIQNFDQSIARRYTVYVANCFNTLIILINYNIIFHTAAFCESPVESQQEPDVGQKCTKGSYSPHCQTKPSSKRQQGPQRTQFQTWRGRAWSRWIALDPLTLTHPRFCIKATSKL